MRDNGYHSRSYEGFVTGGGGDGVSLRPGWDHPSYCADAHIRRWFPQASQPTLSVDENERAPANQGDAGELAHAGTEWEQLFDQQQERQSRDPDQIHEAAHEQEPH